MEDKEWLEVIKSCQRAGREHKRLLAIAEQEYEARYGQNPSDVDDDWWIDTVNYCTGETTLEQIDKAAKFCLDD